MRFIYFTENYDANLGSDAFCDFSYQGCKHINPSGLVRDHDLVATGSMTRSRVFQSKQTHSALINPFAQDRAILRNARSRYRSLRHGVRKLGIRIKIQEGAAP